MVRVRRIRLSELACGAPLRQLGWANWIESIALWRAGIRVLDGILIARANRELNGALRQALTRRQRYGSLCCMASARMQMALPLPDRRQGTSPTLPKGAQQRATAATFL